MAGRKLQVRRETFPIRGHFTISRGSRTESQVIVVELQEDGRRGWGECVPYARYGESLDSVQAQIEGVAAAVEGGLDRQALLAVLPAGAARNAVDCALLDLEAKRSGTPAWKLLGLPAPEPVVTAFTLSLDSPEKMAQAAAAAADRPLMKLKLGGEGDIARVEAVRQAAPGTRLIVDANEAWLPEMVVPYSAALAACGVELIEQPLPAARDAALAALESAVPLCADESCHTREGLAELRSRYDFVNIKLDKTGGLTEAVALATTARDLGLGIMVGCMLGSSLGMAPAVLLAGMAGFVDLDGPLLLARDREPGLRYDGSIVHPADSALWG